MVIIYCIVKRILLSVDPVEVSLLSLLICRDFIIGFIIHY